uniref:Putative ribonuclease H-like domain-containing protein n=1 Tax=Tanacetum cinerariifolium TaxID=118510 RepID=A0A6L2KM59_TANCI|nr:putative ribonuclease H-like domain-containing protein [Tanacetum cinerariifolium]
MVPAAVLTQSTPVPITAVRPVSTTMPKIKVTRPRHAKHIVTKTNSPLRRHINRPSSPKVSNSSLIVTDVKAPVGNPQHALKDKGVIDSGCSRNMTGNISYLSDFEELNGGYVAFGGVKVNLFNDTECLVLSPEFKLPDESQVLLRVPRENNMYNVNLKNIVPSRDLTCLFAKATIDESNPWHRRLGHINFKTMNKLVKGNLVRGLPTKFFENDNTFVACKKGKQHRASCKTKPVSSVDKPLYMLHMDLFRPTFVKSLNKKSYCLVVTDDYSRFTWVFFLATKDETSPILKTFITGLENQLSLMVKVIRSDNGTEFKNNDLNQFCGMKGIKREFSKFDGKVDEGFLIRYSVSSKAFRVFNSRTRLVQETLHVNFLENKPNITGSGPTWLFDIDTLTKTMNYQPVTAENQYNPSAGFQDKFDAEKAGEDNNQKYVLFLVWSSGSTNPQNTNGDAAFDEKEPEFDEKKPESKVNVFLSSSDQSKKQDYKTNREAKGKSPVESFTGYRNLSAEFKDFSDNSVNEVNAAGTLVPIVRQIYPNSTNTFSVAGPSNAAASLTHGNSSFIDVSQLPDDPEMPELEDITYSDDKDDVGVEADFNNLETSITVSPIQITRVHKDHLVTQIIGDLSSATQTRSMARVAKIKEEGIDYEEVFAPVARIEAIRLVLAYASFMNFMVYQMDVKSAFLYGTIKEEVYVCQPLGFEDPNYPNKVYKVVKVVLSGMESLKRMETITGKDISNPFMAGVNTPRSDEDRLEKMELTVFLLPSDEKVRVKVSVIDLQVSAVRLMLLLLVRNVDSPSKFYMYPHFLQLIIRKQVGDLSTHTTKYTSPALTHKVFANIRRVGKGFFRVETQLFEGMLVALEVEERDADENVANINVGDAAEGDVSAGHDEVPTADEEPSIPSPTPPTPPPQPSHYIPSTSQDVRIPMNLLQDVMDTCITLTRRVEHLELDKIAQALEITKLKRRVKKLKRRNKVNVLKLRRLQKVETAQRIDTSNDTVMDDVSNQGRMIANMDADANVVLKEPKEVADNAKDDQDADVQVNVDIQGRIAKSQAEIYKIDLDYANKVLSMQEEESKPVELQEVVDIVTTAKIINEVITAASTTNTAVDVLVTATITTAAPSRLTAAPSKRTKGVVIRDPEESTTTTSTIVYSEAKSKDKGKGILVEEPKPLKKQAQIEQNEKYARELEAKLNITIDWDEVIDHVNKKAKEDPAVKRYQALKRKPQTEAQARKNMMLYLKNVAGFKIDYFKRMSYDDIRLIFEAKFNSNVAFL